MYLQPQVTPIFPDLPDVAAAVEGYEDVRILVVDIRHSLNDRNHMKYLDL